MYQILSPGEAAGRLRVTYGPKDVEAWEEMTEKKRSVGDMFAGIYQLLGDGVHVLRVGREVLEGAQIALGKIVKTFALKGTDFCYVDDLLQQVARTFGLSVSSEAHNLEKGGGRRNVYDLTPEFCRFVLELTKTKGSKGPRSVRWYRNLRQESAGGRFDPGAEFTREYRLKGYRGQRATLRQKTLRAVRHLRGTVHALTRLQLVRAFNGTVPEKVVDVEIPRPRKRGKQSVTLEVPVEILKGWAALGEEVSRLLVPARNSAG